MRARFTGSEADALADPSRLTAAEADRDALYAENLDLKARLGRSDSAPARTLAGVLLRPPATPYDTLVIDAGSAEGVLSGELVSAGGSALVGTIAEVSQHSSRVTLFSAPGSQYQGFLRGTVPVTVEGIGGGSMQAKIPSGTVAAVGDFVELPGIAGGVGAKVRQVDSGESESFSTLYFMLPADIFSLRLVEVWKTHP